jgi:hypothetical protein
MKIERHEFYNTCTTAREFEKMKWRWNGKRSPAIQGPARVQDIIALRRGRTL